MKEVKTAKGGSEVLLVRATEGSTDQLRATLRELGLGGYAADAFGALAGLPQATAAELMVRTGIPDSKIYYALDDLVDRGLVEVQAGKPKTYRVVPPREVKGRLERMLEAKHGQERAAVTKVVGLLEPLRATTASPAVDLAYIVKGLPNVLSRARAMVAGARREVLFLASEEPFLRSLEADLARAARRKVHMRLALPNVDFPKELERAAEVRSILCSCVVLVVDGVQVFTISRTADGSAYGITSTDETLVRLALEYWDSPRCCAE